MKKSDRRNSRIDEMVDVFGYDYAIGFCVCSEYDVRKLIEQEEDEVKRKKLIKVADSYSDKADKLTRERIKNGL